MAQVSSSRAALVAVALLGAACVGGDGPLQTRDQAFSWDGPAGPGTTVRVRDMNGDIEVVPSADTMVRATASIAWRRGNPDRSLHFSGAREGNDILICAVWGKGECSATKYTSNFRLSRSGTDAKVHFRVEVPAGVRLELRGMNGNVTATAQAPVEARTLNGDIRVVTAVGPARGETTNGSVDLRMASLTGADSVIAKTLNGDVFVYLPEAVDATVDLATTNGTASTDFPSSVTFAAGNRTLKAVLGKGSHQVLLRSLNGSAALRRLDAQGRSATP